MLVLHGADKAQAKAGGERVPEALLHGLALIGGFAGAIIGMLAFRHKTRKVAFWATAVLGLVLHVVLLWYWEQILGSYLPSPW